MSKYNQNPLIDMVGLENFHLIISTFKKKASTTGLSAEEHLAYNLVRNLSAQRGFTPIKNQTKLLNGMREMFAYELAAYRTKWLLNQQKFALLEQWTQAQPGLASQL